MIDFLVAMDDPTPDIDTVAPLLEALTKQLIQKLSKIFEVETMQDFLFGSTRQIEVPVALQGVPVEIKFEIGPRTKLSIRIDYGRPRRWLCSERIRMARVLRHIVQEVHLALERHKQEADLRRRAEQAQEAFDRLTTELGFTSDGGQVKKGRLLLECLPNTPTQVRLTILLPHTQALEAVQKYYRKHKGD